MSFGPAISDCPAAKFHPADLVPENHPGMGLTPAETQRVADALTPFLTEHFTTRQQWIQDWLECLHPMPLESNERRTWGLKQPGTFYTSMEGERDHLASLHRAFARNDWTTLLYAFTRPANSAQRLTPQGIALQPLREELDGRRLELRKNAARRLGCTCYDDPEATAETRKAAATAQTVPTARYAESATALQAEAWDRVDRRRWEMPKETAQDLARAVSALRDEVKLAPHVVLGEMAAVALERLPEVRERVLKVQAEREQRFAAEQAAREAGNNV